MFTNFFLLASLVIYKYFRHIKQHSRQTKDFMIKIYGMRIAVYYLRDC